MNKEQRNFLMCIHKEALELTKENETIARRIMEQYSYRFLQNIREVLDCLAAQYLSMASMGEYNSLYTAESAAEMKELNAQAKADRKIGKAMETRVKIADEVIHARKITNRWETLDSGGQPVECATTHHCDPRFT